jgi:carboxylate-amine ligase
MLLRRPAMTLAQCNSAVLREIDTRVSGRLTVDTHASLVEFATVIHSDVAGVAIELAAARRALRGELDRLGLAAAIAGTHPFASWEGNRVSNTARYRELGLSMRGLLAGPPTSGLHVHVGVPDPEDAVRLLNAFGLAAPVLLALSASSPFFQGADTGLCSMRTALLERFPRSGTARPYRSYADYVRAVDGLIRAGAISDPTHLWWDVRLQPALGTVEVRVMDGQSTVAESAALSALVQSMARLEIDDGPLSRVGWSPEVLRENRFLAARDGMAAVLISDRGGRVSVRELAEDFVERSRPHAAALGCAAELSDVIALMDAPGAERQRAWRRMDGGDLRAIATRLAERYAS